MECRRQSRGSDPLVFGTALGYPSPLPDSYELSAESDLHNAASRVIETHTLSGAISFQGCSYHQAGLLARESHGRESNPTQGATPVPMHTLPTRTVRPSCDSRRAEYLKPIPFGTISFRGCPQNPLSLLSIDESVLRELNPVSLFHNLGSARLYQLA